MATTARHTPPFGHPSQEGKSYHVDDFFRDYYFKMMETFHIRSHESLSRLLVLLAVIILGSVILINVTALPAAAGEHDEEGELEHAVTTDGKTGINLILAQLYNEDRLMYSLVVTLTMAILGIVVAQVTEWLLKLVGAKKAGGTH